MVAISNTMHRESLHACFTLKFLSPGRWKWLLASMQNAALYNCWFSPTQRDLYRECSTIYCVTCKEKKIDINDLRIFGGKCFIQPSWITDLLLQNHGVHQHLPALLWDCLRPERRG